jgi:hypothetical protein
MNKMQKKKPARPMVGVRRTVPPASPPVAPSTLAARPKSPSSPARPRNPAPNLPNARAAGPIKPRNPEVLRSPSEVPPEKSLVELVAAARESFERIVETEGRFPALHVRAIMMGRRLKQLLRKSETLQAEFKAALVKEDIAFSSRQPYGAVFRLLYGPYRQEKSKFSRYNRIAQYADDKKLDQDQLLIFLKEHGGLNKSAIAASRLLRGEDETTARRIGKSKPAAKAPVEVDADFVPDEFDLNGKWLDGVEDLRQKKSGLYSCVYEQMEDRRILCYGIRPEPDYSVLKGYDPFKK